MTEKSATIADFIGGSPFGEEAPPFKQGRPSEHELGVAYFGPWTRQGDGFSEHVRRCALALSGTGCPVHLRRLGGSETVVGGVPQELPPKLGPLLTQSISQYSVQIYQVVFRGSYIHNLTSHQHMTSDELASVNRRRVVYSVFESNRIDDATARALNRVGQVWVACQANAEMLRQCGVDSDKVRVVPIPFSEDDPLVGLRARERKPGVPRFYHIGKWEPRKAQDQILTAFMRAFKPGEAHLVLKTSKLVRPIDGYPQTATSWIAHLCANDSEVVANGWKNDNWHEWIELLTKFLSDEQIVMLHRFGNVYVTLSRGEGFDMPAFDAKIAWNMLVYTRSGGPQDFADSADVAVRSNGTVPVHSFYDPVDGARYLDYDVRDAVFAMREAARRIRATDRPHVQMPRLSGFLAPRVGRVMLDHLTDLVKGPVFKGQGA